MALTDSLQGYWKLDESSGDAADATASGNTLTNTNSVTYSTGKINNAAVFDKTTKYLVSGASPANLNITGDISIQAWVNVSGAPTSDVDTYTIQTRQTFPAGTNCWHFRYLNESNVKKIWAGYWSDNTTQTSSLFLQDLGTSAWHHLVVTMAVASKAIVLYVDGSSVSVNETRDTSSTAIQSATIGVAIGALPATPLNPFNGSIDEVGIWSRVLTSGEVTSLYNGGSGLAYPLTVASTGKAPRRMMLGYGI